MAPEYEKVGEAVAASGNTNVVVAKMDATANEVDHPGVNIKGFPTILFFPANAAKVPVEYDGARDADGFVAFLKKHASTPLNIESEDDLEL